MLGCDMERCVSQGLSLLIDILAFSDEDAD